MSDQYKIIDDDRRIFEAIASAEIVDTQGDLIPIDHIMKSMPDFVMRGAPITFRHSNLVVGKILSYQKVDYNGVPAIKITGMIYNNNRCTNTQ